MILDGKRISEELLQELEQRLNTIKNSIDRSPKLEIILIGNDFASEKYVSMKQKKATDLGIEVNINRFDETSTENEIINTLKELNNDNSVDGIMIQLPLPKNFNEDEIISHISIEKDVDGLTAESLGKLFRKEECFVSATPKGIGILLDKYKIEIEGKSVVIVGRSKIVGLPVSALMLNKNATVTICHSHTKDLQNICKSADILIVGIGKPNFINEEFVKEGSTVIDVGFNKDSQNGKTVGDVNFERVKDLVKYITPVPGGVGPMTIVSLLENVINSYQKTNA